MRRLFSLLLLVLCATAAPARVISYAPYSDQTAMRGYHARTTRYFALAESANPNMIDGAVFGRVVLYDSTGAEPPRVIFPANGGTDMIRAVALREEPGLTPVILVITGNGPSTSTFISVNGGRSWRLVEEVSGMTLRRSLELDYGGPWTYGMAPPVRIGTRATPFVVAFEQGVYAIPARLRAHSIFFGATRANTLLGQNREGTEFLLFSYRDTLVVSDLKGEWKTVGKPTRVPTAGWIAPDGSVYAVFKDNNRRDVCRYVDRREELIATGQYGNSFAIPTHDFDGFWYLDKEPKEITNLSRYTPETGLQLMWSDEDGPDVEALHAGASGDTLLIQVHRPRNSQNLEFIDPALAIWRVGEPAPAAYDELFLNELDSKGFVHLDVDAAAAGAPFVFDSGLPVVPDIIISPPPTSPPLGGGSDVIQEWGVVRASLAQRLVIQGATRRDGRVTDLVIYNPVDGEQRVDLEFVAGSAKKTATITLAAKEIRVISDALSSLFAVEEGAGVLHFLPQYGINVLAQVHLVTAAGRASHVVQAVDFMNAAGPRFPVTFSGAMPGSEFESTLILTDTSGHGIDAMVRAYEHSGSSADTRITMPAEITATPLANAGGIVVRPERGSLIAGALAIDKLTGDATYFAPDIPASFMRTVPFVANVTNDDGSFFRSDLYLMNLSANPRRVTIEVKPYDTAQWPRTQTLHLAPFESRVVVNPLQSMFGLTGIARMRYSSPTSFGDTMGVRVTSRSYTNAANGGTYGTAVPPLNSFQSVTGSEGLEILGIVSGFRASLGLVELSPNPRNQPANVRISIYDDRGNVLDTFEQQLQAAGGLFIDDLFKARNIPQPAAARITVQALDAWSLVGAYALLTEPSTNDPTYLGPQLAAKPK